MILTLLRLFWEFFKTGLFSVGGGLATLPFIYDISDKTGWFTHAQIADMIAVAESTPGPIGINMATYVGYTTAGIAGSLCATLGIIVPPITIILIIAKFLQRFRESTLVDHAFYGLRPASSALIAAAGVSVVKIALLDLPAFAASHAAADLFAQALFDDLADLVLAGHEADVRHFGEYGLADLLAAHVDEGREVRERDGLAAVLAGGHLGDDLRGDVAGG